MSRLPAPTVGAPQPSTVHADPRQAFAHTVATLIEERDDTALVYAEISGQYWGAVQRAHPDRVINVGIREQLMINVAAGLSLTGLRPVAHTFGAFLVERAFEQIKLGFSHQGLGGVLVGSGGSFDIAAGGRTHQAPGDVALIDTLPDWDVYVPGHVDEVRAAVVQAVAGGGRDYIRVEAHQNATAYPVVRGRFHSVTRGSSATVLAVGPMLAPTLEAVRGLDVTVLYANSIRPFDHASLRRAVSRDVVVVEPYLAGTSARHVADALRDVAHRLLCLGVGRLELRRYGTADEHRAAHGLDPQGLRSAIAEFVREGRSGAT